MKSINPVIVQRSKIMSKILYKEKFTLNSFIRLRIKNIIFMCLIFIQTCFALDKVTLQLQWLPQSQFAGFLVAKEKGYYENAGLSVDIVAGGPNIIPFDSLTQKKATFCTAWLAEGIRNRSQGTALVNVAQLIQKSGLLLVAKRASKIGTPADLNGKTIGVWSDNFFLQPSMFFKNYNIQATLINQGYSINPFLRGALDVVSAMYYNEYHRIYEAGFDFEDLSVFWFADYDLNYPEDGIYCMEETWNNSPDMCLSFVNASLQGWQWAFLNSREAVEIVMAYCHQANMATSQNHQTWMLQAIKELMLFTEENTIDYSLNEKDFCRVDADLRYAGLTTFPVQYEGFFVTRGIPHDN